MGSGKRLCIMDEYYSVKQSLQEYCHKANNKVRLIKNRYNLSRHNDKGWMRKIKECQEEIANSNPHPHYLSEYRGSEISYWLHIPKWMYEDSKKKTIKRCLDIGCAYGTLALYCKRLFKCEVYCIDFVETYINQELAKRHFFFKLNNIELDPFPWEGQYDVIIFTEVLEHLNLHPVPTLKKINDLLALNGVLYLSTPDASQWGRVTKYYANYKDMPAKINGLDVVDDHIYHYNKHELLEIIDEAGFRIERLKYSPGLLNRNFNLTLVKS